MDNQSESVGLDAGKGPIRSIVSRSINDHFALVLIGVPALTILVLFIWPVIWVLFQSVWVDYPGVPPRFEPIGNYEQVYIRSRFYSSLHRTLIYAFGSLGLSVTSGLLLALALNQVRRRWIRTAYVTVLAWMGDSGLDPRVDLAVDPSRERGRTDQSPASGHGSDRLPDPVSP